MKVKSFKILGALSTVLFLIYIVYYSITTDVVFERIVARFRTQISEHKVYGKDADCAAYFSSSLKENLKSLLRMKSNYVTEITLRKLGFPNRKTMIKTVETLDIQTYNQTHPIHSKIPVIVAAASSNHFPELQALFEHIDKNLRHYFPDIKIVLFDIGLNEKQRNIIKHYGKCDMRRFPFEKYPEHIKILHLCAWKAIIIQIVLQEYCFVFYMDTSVRPRGDTLEKYFNESEKTGHIFRSTTRNKNYIPVHTFSGTFQYFNVPPCLFHNLNELEGGFILMRNDNLVSKIIMRAWLTCVLQEKCIMPSGAEHHTSCAARNLNYHKCHRNDQSALGIAAMIIYHIPSQVPLVNLKSAPVFRGNRSNYLSELATKRPTNWI